jgi:hypothetical protein
MPVTTKQKPDQFTPEEIQSMQRRAFKLLVDRAIDRHQRDSREEAAVSAGEEASDGNG